jgi:heat-inducible transcriptional repressor
MDLTPRKREILRRVVEEYVANGQPVGSKALVGRSRMDVSSSTVRNELSELEALGLLTHPHTSAGRVPTEAGYRHYAEELVDAIEGRPGPFPIDLTAMRNELEEALRQTTETLSEATHLLALVTAPSIESAAVRHVEVLQLQPRVVIIVVITASGAVSKRVFEFGEPVDPGLVEWAGAYLNETVAGHRITPSLLRRQFADPGLAIRERLFLEIVRPAFADVLEHSTELYVGGAASLVGEARGAELEACQRLLETLERRAAVLELLSEALDPQRTVVRVGPAVEGSDLHDVAYVGSTYGLAHRSLGAVALLGPLRMDYDKAIRSVRAAAFELSRLVEEVYEGV